VTCQGRKASGIKAPSFKGLQPASASASRSKSKNKRVDTSHELLLRRKLWRLGLRFRKHVSSLPGKPDVIFPSVKVAVFCGGDFWHGRNWTVLKRNLGVGTNSSYWTAKISSNMKRDARNTALLKAMGWYVIRVWETDIQRDPIDMACRVKKAVSLRRTRKTRSCDRVKRLVS